MNHSLRYSQNQISSRHVHLFWRTVLSFLSLLILSASAWAYSPYTTNELDELEKEFIELINQSNSVLRDPLASQYINHLGRTLARTADLTPPYFFIVKSDEINAFAGPGGYIGFNSRLILASDNESELAGVMAHELAHVRLHHLYRMLEHQKQMRVPMLASMLASAALGIINPTLGSGALMASLTGVAQDKINFVRSNEKEADRVGIDMLIQSGQDPRGMANFFKKIQQSARYYYTDNIPAILRTHPLDEDRIAEAENRTAHLPQKAHPTGNEYYLFKELVRAKVTTNDKKLIDYYQNQCMKSNNNACRYGQALAYLNINAFDKAEKQLQALLKNDPDNLYYGVAMASAQIGLRQFGKAISLTSELHANYPENYAAILAHADILVAANQAPDATDILLKASRTFPNNLSVCRRLAKAQALSHHKDYAYFTDAHCELLQGKRKPALNKLKLARTLCKNNSYLQARIQAKIEEVKGQ